MERYPADFREDEALCQAMERFVNEVMDKQLPSPQGDAPQQLDTNALRKLLLKARRREADVISEPEFMVTSPTIQERQAGVSNDILDNDKTRLAHTLTGTW